MELPSEVASPGSDWPDLSPRTPDSALWTQFGTEIAAYVPRRRGNLGVPSGIETGDLVNEVVARTMARVDRADSSDDIRRRLLIGGVRRAFADGCIRFIVMEHFRRNRRQIQNQLHARVEDEDDPSHRAGVEEIRELLFAMAAENPMAQLVLDVEGQNGRAAVEEYRLRFGLSVRTARRHYLKGIEDLRNGLEEAGFGPVSSTGSLDAQGP